MPDHTKRPRFFVPAASDSLAPTFAAGREVALPPTEAHHAAHVLRLRAGDAVELFDGRGGSAVARLVRARRGDVAAAVETVGPAASRPRPALDLAFAVPKGKRLDWLLEKATELGAASLRPVRFARSVAGAESLSAAARERWRAHTIAAAKQSGLAFLPEIREALPLGAFCAGARPGVYGDAAAGAASAAEAFGRVAGAPAIVILVGPEGGLTDDERRLADAAGLLAVRLGRTTLRTETAAVALLAVAAALAGSS